MKHLTLLTICALLLASCATMTPVEKQEPVEPQIVETSVWLSVPQDIEKSEPTAGSWLSENGKIRWVPVGKLRYHKASGVLFAPAVSEPKPDEPEKR